MPPIKTVMCWLFGLLFIAAGILHFVQPEFYIRIMPPYLSWPETLVFISGVFEVSLGFLLLVPRFTRLAAWGSIALLIAVFPANLHMALHPDLFPQFSPAGLWGRLPIQGLLIVWAWWFTKVYSAEG